MEGRFGDNIFWDVTGSLEVGLSGVVKEQIPVANSEGKGDENEGDGERGPT